MHLKSFCDCFLKVTTSQNRVNFRNFRIGMRREMTMKLKGKVAFITGFGSGLGRAIAVVFAKEGAAVAGTSPTQSKGRETVELVEKLGGTARYWPGDVTDSQRMKSIIAETVQQLGGIDIVVNSGGVRTNGSI